MAQWCLGIEKHCCCCAFKKKEVLQMKPELLMDRADGRSWNRGVVKMLKI